MSSKRMLGFRALGLLCVLGILSASTLAVAAQTCGPIYSPGNPYPCGNGGNCTFWAWHQARTVWGQILPGWGNAKTWADSARSAGYPVSLEPGSRTLGVSSFLSSDGHVWWNDYITWNALKGSEMMWGKYGVNYNANYQFSTANKGFIYPKPMWWRPIVYFTVAPVLWVRPYDQTVGVAGTNFKPGMVVDVTFPNGNMTTLQGSQVQYSSGSYFSIRVTLSVRGWWKFRTVASDGQRSDPFWVFVN